MLRDGFNCGLFANAFAAVTGDIAYRVFLWYNYNARTFVRVLRKREAEFISEVSICCGKQRLQDFWYLSCMILQVKKAHIVWKKPIFYFDFCRFSYTFWLKGVFNFLKEDNLISLARGLSRLIYPSLSRFLMLSFILLCFPLLAFARYFISNPRRSEL